MVPSVLAAFFFSPWACVKSGRQARSKSGSADNRFIVATSRRSSAGRPERVGRPSLATYETLLRRTGAGSIGGMTRQYLPFLLATLLSCASSTPAWAEMEWVKVGKDQRGFVLAKSGRPFIPWGLNYDHDEKGRLLEDYWEAEWPKVER